MADNARVRIADVRDLVLWVLAEGSNPSWAFIKVITQPLMSMSCRVALGSSSHTLGMLELHNLLVLEHVDRQLD